MPDQFTRRSDFMKLTGYSDDTCRRWERAGRLTAYKLNGDTQQGRVSYDLDEANAMIDAARVRRRARLIGR